MLTEVVLVNTPPAYGEDKWTNNIIWMLRDNLKYDSIKIITEPEFGGVYDKIKIFNECKENKQYIYFDLDLVIKGKISHLLKKEFTLLYAWWRPKFHTPLNSSIMSWQGDYSHIYKKFVNDSDYYMIKYNKGIDEFLYRETEYKLYDKVCDSYRWKSDGNYRITLYNQSKDEIWKQKYSLSG